jgi:hypothetical protein
MLDIMNMLHRWKIQQQEYADVAHIMEMTSCETRGKYASKESHAFEDYCDVNRHLYESSPRFFGNLKAT